MIIRKQRNINKQCCRKIEFIQKDKNIEQASMKSPKKKKYSHMPLLWFEKNTVF